jgi:halimadienyl-diphosphate synthase
MTNIESEIQELIKIIGPGHMSSTVYDTAWVARLGDINPDLSNQAMEWICENQLPDGGWGARDIFYYHDRVVCTLAAMIALTYRGRRAYDRKQIDLGLDALGRIVGGATTGLQADPNGATIGFEMIVPTLVAEAEKLGIIKQQGESILKRLGQLRAKKLSRIQGKLINKYTTMAFSAEMAGADGQGILDVENLQESNGSVGHSPSATAYFTMYVKKQDERALEYLSRTIQEDGGVPNVAPFDAFEISWTLWNLSLAPNTNMEIVPGVRKLLNVLANAWEANRGIGFATQYSVKDSDMTSFVFDTLMRFGYKKDAESILSYEEEDHFRCYPLEVDPSISANIHVLGALRQAGFKPDDPSVKKIIRFLKKVKGDFPFWVDKWHSSPYYATSHAVIACAGYVDDLVKDSVDWLISSQHENGAWGHNHPTAEETAYAVQSLWIWGQSAGKIKSDIIKNGAKWLEQNLDQPYHPLWIGKCLYSPNLVVRSAILNAITLGR